MLHITKLLLQDTKSMIKYFITPLLFSIYPVIFLYTHNQEILALNQLKSPLLFAVLFTTLIFLACKLLLKQNLIASLAAVGFLILFWNYALFYNGITYFFSLNHWHILPSLLFLYGHLVYFICSLSKRFDIENLHKIIFAVVSVLIIFNFFYMIPAEVKKYQIISQKEVYHEIGKKEIDSGNYPDIYLIILDEYARFDTIMEEWGYDNYHFFEFLTNKGFFVADKSETRFASTAKFLPSLMDLEYIDDKISVAEAMQKITNSKLLSYFDNLGFQVVYLDAYIGRPEYKLNNKNILHKYVMDLDFEENDMLNDFNYLVAMKTILNPVISIIDRGESSRWYQSTKYYLNYIASYPDQANKIEQPSFLFAHIMCPHIPFVFDRYGNFIENPTNYFEYKSLDKDVLKFLYLEQYIYITNKIKDVVDEIFKKSKNEPIIFLMSDHGPRAFHSGGGDVAQSHHVLNAIYFPDGDYTDLYNNIASINTLRVVLNKYFNQNFEMLEDR